MEKASTAPGDRIGDRNHGNLGYRKMNNPWFSRKNARRCGLQRQERFCHAASTVAGNS